MVILANVLLTTARALYNASTTATPAPLPWLSGVRANASRNPARTLTDLKASALEGAYKFKVDMGTDIVEGDQITLLTLLDGLTPWPNAALTTGVNGTWWVVLVSADAPGLLAELSVYVKLEVTQGPAQGQ